jgi:hypothetical protein
MRTVIALFEDLAEARRTAKDLAQSGLSLDQISVVSPETAPTSGTTVDLPLDTMNLSGVGEVAACGPMIEYMRSAAATEPGTLTDVLVRMGLSDQDAQRFVDGIKHGYTLESAIVDDDKAQQAHQIMQDHLSAQKGAKPSGDTRASSGDTQTSAGTQAAAGGTRVSSGDTRASAGTTQASSGSTQASSSDTQVSSDRTTGPADLSRADEGDVEVIEVVDVIEPLPSFDVSSYEDHFTTNYGSSEGADINQYRPAYQYGARADFGGGDWDSVEAKAQSGWEEKNPGTWDRFKNAIKHAWERAKSEIKS